MIDFTKKIGFICNNEYEWINCQKELFKKGFYWTDNNNKPDYYRYNGGSSYPKTLYINISYSSHKKQLEYNIGINQIDKIDILYQSVNIFRKQKLIEILKDEL